MPSSLLAGRPRLSDLSLLQPHRPHSTAQSTIYNSLLSSTNTFVTKLTVLSLLGDEERDSFGRGSHSVVQDCKGHTGCVNAMDWSREEHGAFDGLGRSRLATAGDDTKICIWTPGVDSSTDELDSSVAPSLRFGLEQSIDTGHRANIFSVKWAPFNHDRLFSCAGDATVRVYDVNATSNSRLSSVTVRSGGGGEGPSWTHHEHGTACTNVFRCHTDRVKRICTDGTSPDVFFSCGEDGTVRQHDLRTHHVCRQPGSRSAGAGCGPPLASYEGLSLYSMSISKLRPHLFVCAGTSPYAYLHDRRMLRGPMKADWGVEMKEGRLTQCVRRFCVPNVNGRGVLPNHVVATKMSSESSRDLIVSYSDGPVCLFDIDQEEHVDAVRVDGEDRRKRARRSVQVDERNDESEIDQDGAADSSELTMVEDHEKEESEDEPGPHGHEAAAAGEEDEMDEMDSEDDDEDEPSSEVFSHLRRPRSYHEDVPMIAPRQRYTGHANSATVKDVNFLSFGQDAHVMSGSDDGNWFVWDKESAELVAIYEGDSNVVNVMQAHPRLPLVAISGIDHTVKLFGPTTSLAHQKNLISRRDEIVQANSSGDNNGTRLRGAAQLTAEDVMALIMSRMPPGAALPRVRVRRQPLEGGDGDEQQEEEEIDVSNCGVM
ncbi:hypothetical protein ACM66B_005575 [Microbotryomycetes sp. NB124-2]